MLPSMSYTILKLHKSKTCTPHTVVPTNQILPRHSCMCMCPEHLMKLSMEDLVEFLQVTLSKNFFLEDDFVIEQLQASMSELRRAKLELPAAGT